MQRFLQAALILHIFLGLWRETSAFAPFIPATDVDESVQTTEAGDLYFTTDSQENANSGEENGENHEALIQELTLNWTRAFFNLARRPRQGIVKLTFNSGLVFGLDAFTPRDRDSSSGSGRQSRQFGQDRPSGPDQNDLPATVYVTVTSNAASNNNTRITPLRKLDSSGNPHYVFAANEEKEARERLQRRAAAKRGGPSLLDANERHLADMINTVLSSPRDFLTNTTTREGAVRYMLNKFDSYGLVAGTQEFEPLEYGDLFGDLNAPNGTNIVGILPGQLWGTKEDEIIVLGAHWDTYPNSSGMNDNGSGVAAILEVARALSEGSCKSKHSIVFVAFDLEEVGCLGSIYFIRDFLIPYILVPNGGAKLKGAFILDTIMNFNDSESSQTLSPEWKKLLPQLQESLERENFKGDFLTALYRRDIDVGLASTLAHHWNDMNLNTNKNAAHSRENQPESNEITDSEFLQTVRSSKKFSFKNVRLNLTSDVDTLDTLAQWVDVLRSDHARFWFPNLDYDDPFPAVLITDTGPYRGAMQECYHKPCDSADSNKEIKFGNIAFLAKTCQALIDTVVNLSQAQCSIHTAKPVDLVTVPVTVLTNDNQSVKPNSVSALLGTFLTLLQWVGLII